MNQEQLQRELQEMQRRLQEKQQQLQETQDLKEKIRKSQEKIVSQLVIICRKQNKTIVRYNGRILL